MIVWYLGFMVLLSSATFIAYGLDKRWAMTGRRRIPERTLLMLAFLGGWLGAIVAQRYFRHKTQKLSFQVLFWLVVVLHIVLCGLAIYLLSRVSASISLLPTF